MKNFIKGAKATVRQTAYPACITCANEYWGTCIIRKHKVFSMTKSYCKRYKDGLVN
jgi:hypothetical protein